MLALVRGTDSARSDSAPGPAILLQTGGHEETPPCHICGWCRRCTAPNSPQLILVCQTAAALMCTTEISANLPDWGVPPHPPKSAREAPRLLRRALDILIHAFDSSSSARDVPLTQLVKLSAIPIVFLPRCAI